MNLEVKKLNIDSLKPYKNNARKHSDRQIQLIASSILNLGFNNPVLIDKKNRVIAGHGRLLAAQQLKMKKIPAICLEHMSEDQIRAYIIADNRLAELAGWDDEVLSIELQHLSSIDLGFDIETVGFSTGEIDFLIEEINTNAPDPLDELAQPEKSKPAITKPGDLWLLGNHRLYCGDSLKEKSYTVVMDGKKAQMVFTDPPFNVPIDGHTGGKGSIKHREFTMATGEMTQEQFTTFLSRVFSHLVSYSVDGSIHFQCMDWRHIREILEAAHKAGYEHKNMCVWAKDNGGMGSLYRSRHELVFVFKNGKASHINNVELGKNGRYRTNVWEYAGANTFRKDRMDELAMHPTVKPVALVADAIMDCSKRRGIILDPFGGSGTTLIAAEKTGRHARLIEIDPHYCDVIVKRWEKMADQKAVRRNV